ncbi:MAG: hypothetical protein Q9160_007742 [Pyrenula sp. 1 TL-2023]
MASGILKVQGDQVVNSNGESVTLRGAALGGWMNMENFITGYPGHESQHRAAMLKVLGKENYEFFFDKFLEYFFTEGDAKYFASLGLNCLRLPFNYHHFEDDMNPRVLKESGFKHLDRVVDLCAQNGIYTILDLHTAPGGQNGDWHSDNPTPHPAFWDHKDHQDRTIWLWEQLAAHYKGNAWVAGYNPINEPCDPQHVRLPAFYNRLEPAIRKIDPDHILWLDGNTFAMEWKGFETVLPNAVYALHDYSMMGFPTGPTYTSTPAQNTSLESSFIRKCLFMTTHNTPIWNGEFGPVYASPTLDPTTHTSINTARLSLLKTQLGIYTRYSTHWSLWLYKDIGLQGMVHTSASSPWNTLLAPLLAKKRTLQLDAWGRRPSPDAEAALKALVEWIDQVAPHAQDTYPTPWKTERHLYRNVFQTFLASSFSEEFAGLFAGKGRQELEELARSFAFEECVQREGLNGVLKENSKVPVGGVKVPVWKREGEEGDELP